VAPLKTIFVKPGLLIQLGSPNLSHEHNSPHAHNNHNYNRIIKERDRQVTQKMWWGEQENGTIGIFYYVQARQ